ncbi:MAG: hypothetical protein IPJ19_02380 [Planctomycetes bacterium]|nr:hypothetical protein [Planctomycetota bacterium]
MRAVDARTGELLDRVRVRAASATRIADREATSGGDLQLQLTPGRYELLLLSRGYEPLALVPVELAPATTRALPESRLREGSARVLGFVRGDPSGLQVEFTTCPRCGYSKTATLRPLEADGRFDLSGLAGGPYVLRLVDSRRTTVGMAQSFTLGEGQVFTLDLDGAFRRLAIEVLDVDGYSLSAEWASRLAARPPEQREVEVVEVVGGPSLRFECTFRSREGGFASSEFEAPTHPGVFSASGHHGVRVGFSGRRLGGGGSHVDDRPRAPTDELAPRTPAPNVPPTVLEAHLGEDGCACFEPLSTCPWTLELHCGPYHATLEIPAGSEAARLQARLALDTLGDEPAQTFLEWEARGGR